MYQIALTIVRINFNVLSLSKNQIMLIVINHYLAVNFVAQ